jgi:hypothetical protein
MKQYQTTWLYPVALAVLVSGGPGVCSGGGADKDDAPRPLPPEVVKAWRDAGADPGWMKDLPPHPTAGYGYWVPFREKVETGALPAFRFHPEKNGVLGRLPDPGVAFGLDLHCCAGTDAQLKQLAALKSLHSLNIGGALLLTNNGLKEVARLTNLRALYLFYGHVGDAGLKELAPLKDLRVLDLTHTQVTDGGLKEVARLKNLEALNLTGTKVTAAGVAALQRELPSCKITTGTD